MEFTNQNRTRHYGLRVGDEVIEEAFGMETKGIVERLSHDNNRAWLKLEDGSTYGAVCEWCKIITKIEDKEKNHE